MVVSVWNEKVGGGGDLKVFWAIWRGNWLYVVGRVGGLDGQQSGCGQLMGLTKQQQKRDERTM